MNKQAQNHPTGSTTQRSQIKLSRAYRIIIFIVLTLCQLFLNTSGGLLSSASTTIKETLNFNNKQFGLFGTFYGLGRTTGSIIFMLIIDHVNRKYYLCLSALLKSILLVGFTFTHNGVVLLSLRGLTGIAHVSRYTYVIMLCMRRWQLRFTFQYGSTSLGSKTENCL